MERQHVNEGILRIKNLNLTYAYLKDTKENQEKVCLTILEKAFASFQVPETFERRADIVTKLLERSIKQLEEEQEFEECQILLDIQTYIPTLIKKIKSQAAQESGT